jgi:putative peptide zinc metalloprotease protein
VQQIWDATSAHLGDEAPTQEDAIRLLGQLHAADALLCDVPPDSMEVFRRYERMSACCGAAGCGRRWRCAFRCSTRTASCARRMPLVQPLFSWFGMLLWLAVVGTGAVLAASHWKDLTENIADRVLDPANLVLLWFVYPVVKALHELGHAYATRRWGGEVHEIGMMLLVLSPVPYVDASSAWGFRDKRKRMVVGAAGIAVELFLGALALFVWLMVEPGAVRAVAYNVMLISGVSTLLFNGNPLLRFDGYYVLADAIEIPNLGARSNSILGTCSSVTCSASRRPRAPAHSTGERVWMVVYGIASFIYRIFISFIIITFIAGKFFVIGILLAIWALATQVLMPVGKSLSFLFKARTCSASAGARWSTTLALAALAGGPAVHGAVRRAGPAPRACSGCPRRRRCAPGTDGFLVTCWRRPGSEVRKGQPLIQAEEPFLATRVAMLEAQLTGADRQVRRAGDDGPGAGRHGARGDHRRARPTCKRAASGWTAWCSAARPMAASSCRTPNDLPGRFITKGQLVGYVVEPREITARVALLQDDIAMVRQDTRSVEVMLAGWDASPLPARIRREVPGCLATDADRGAGHVRAAARSRWTRATSRA